MKKLLYFIGCISAALFCLTGCGGRKPAITDTSELSGTWYGCGNALGKDSSFRADNLCLSIDSQGGLILSDIEQNSDLFHGTVSIDSGSRISITADTAFDNRLPEGWEDFSGTKDFAYRAPDTEHLLLTCEDTSYYFEKENASIQEQSDTSMSPLLDIAETDIWYTSPDDVTSDFVYELALYDKYAELYSVSPDGDELGTFITNFLYCGNKGEDFSFYTLRDDSMELPDIFTDLPEGISEIDLRLSVSNESLTMDYEGNTLSFYNNVIYGLNTSSTAYYLNNTCFHWRFDQTDHFCYFATDEGSGSLYLYISDGKEGATDANTICGRITVDEAGQNIIFTFDRKKSRVTADKNSRLFQSFRTLDGENGNALQIPYTLNGSELKLKTKKYFGKNYTFDLEDYTNVKTE